MTTGNPGDHDEALHENLARRKDAAKAFLAADAARAVREAPELEVDLHPGSA